MNEQLMYGLIDVDREKLTSGLSIWKEYERVVKEARSWLEEVDKSIEVETESRKVRIDCFSVSLSHFCVACSHVTARRKTLTEFAVCTEKC